MLAALRRLTLLVVGCSLGIAAISALFGALLGASLDRAVALGFYGLGCFLMVSGFFVGNRGPARVKSESAGWSMLPGLGSRRARRGARRGPARGGGAGRRPRSRTRQSATRRSSSSSA